MPSLRRIAHSTSLRATGSWMLCWIDVACEARPARACAIACLTMASSPVDGGGGAACRRRQQRRAATRSRPLATCPWRTSCLSCCLCAGFLSWSSFLAAFLALDFCPWLGAAALACPWTWCPWPWSRSWPRLLARPWHLALADLALAADVSACATAAACSPSPAMAASSNAVSSPWTLVNVPVLPSATDVALPLSVFS